MNLTVQLILSPCITNFYTRFDTCAMRVEGTLTELAVRQSVSHIIVVSCRIQSYSPSGPTHDDHPGQLFRPQLIEVVWRRIREWIR